jgi:hypothetical protein
MRLPSHDRWIWARADNSMCQQLLDLVNNPGTICKDMLKEVHFCYRQPLHQSLIVLEDGLLTFQEPFHESASYT